MVVSVDLASFSEKAENHGTRVYSYYEKLFHRLQQGFSTGALGLPWRLLTGCPGATSRDLY